MRPLENFIRALRAREVRISVIEAMEAHEVLANLGFADRTLLKDALSLTLAKTVIEKQRFNESFDLFFSRDQFNTTITKPSDASEPQADTGNDLADMLLNNDREGLAAAMEDASRKAGIRNIRFRTQVNFMARRMVDQMGLAEFERLIAQVGRGDISGGDTFTAELEAQRSRLVREGRAFVERQYELYGRFTGRQLREEFLERTPLAAVDRRDYTRMNNLIRRMTRKLASKYRPRHKPRDLIFW